MAIFHMIKSMIFVVFAGVTITGTIPENAESLSDALLICEQTVESDCDYVQFRGDVIVWRYKTENGYRYKRKFNVTKQVWIGDWILIGPA